MESREWFSLKTDALFIFLARYLKRFPFTFLHEMKEIEFEYSSIIVDNGGDGVDQALHFYPRTFVREIVGDTGYIVVTEDEECNDRYQEIMLEAFNIPDWVIEALEAHLVKLCIKRSPTAEESFVVMDACIDAEKAILRGWQARQKGWNDEQKRLPIEQRDISAGYTHQIERIEADIEAMLKAKRDAITHYLTEGGDGDEVKSI